MSFATYLTDDSTELNSVLSDIKNKNIKSYKLDENYRNSKEIIKFCNEILPFQMISMGISSKPVSIKIFNSENDIILNHPKDHVILTNNQKLLDIFKENNYECYNIRNAKGLEFSKVVVIDEGFSLEEKYVAYTRTLDSLFIYTKNS